MALTQDRPRSRAASLNTWHVDLRGLARPRGAVAIDRRNGDARDQARGRRRLSCHYALCEEHNGTAAGPKGHTLTQGRDQPLQPGITLAQGRGAGVKEMRGGRPAWPLTERRRNTRGAVCVLVVLLASACGKE